jgi:non-specific serine/threonine protein kinase
VTKEDLLAQVWPGVIVEENALHAQISALRKLLGAEVITTVPGTGYRLALDVTPIPPETKPAAAGGAKHNLPKALTSFIGREQQISELKGLLRQTRLLTLSGAGGCGKTRLALELAAQVCEDYTDGVCLVELALLADPGLIPQAVADVLALKERPGATLTQTILEALEGKHLLLVLDNAEHLLAPCAELAQALLHRCAQLSILVTTRERLGVSGELTYRVPSLSVPDANQRYSLDTLAATESSRLFIERARLQQAHFAVTAQSALAVASICAHLDGIPLAIELAAARVRAISVEELNQRLDQRFRLLSDASRTALPRHRTLAAMIDWSYDLLNAAEKELFRRASIFAGGFSLDAAESVLTGGAVDESAVIDLLTSLVDKNLVQADDQGGTTRYRQLETVRQYGRDRLRESADEPACRERHLAYLVALAESAEDGMRGGGERAWFKRLDVELENLRAALASAAEAGADFPAGLRLAGALFPFWFRSGYWSEGSGWTLRFLEAVPADQMEDVRAKALNGAGSLMQRIGGARSARALLEECLAIRRRLGDRRGISVALRNLGDVMATTGDYAAARPLMEESLAIARESGDRWGISRLATSLVPVLLDQGYIGPARLLAQECFDITRALGGVDGFGVVTLSAVAFEEGDAAAAATLCRDAIARSMDRVASEELLEVVACAESALGHAAVAAVIWGHTECLRKDTGKSFARFDGLRHERSVASARAALGDDAAFDAAWRRGAGMTADQAIAFVLQPSET